LRRSARRVTRPWRRVLVALALSLLVNALVLTRMDLAWKVAPRPAPVRDVALAPLSAAEWAANRAIQNAQPPSGPQAQRPLPAPALPAPAPPPRHLPGQVVDVAPSKDEKAPKDSRYLAERNNTVEKETRSRDARAGYENTLPKPSSPTVRAPAPPPAPPPNAARAEAERRSQATRPGGKPGIAGPRTAPSDAARERLALVPRGELRNPMQPLPSRPRTGDGASAPGEQGAPESGDRSPGTGPLARLDLRPGAAAYDHLAGGPAPDHLEGVEEGDSTYLNTREWKYSGYFNRIKQAVANQWDPGASMAARDPTGARFGAKDWHTLVMVKLDGTGVLKGVSVSQPSGLEFLDRLAVDAFQKAQPFANPPSGLADERGEIVFSFGFYVQMGSSGMRVFRTPR
jgi:TonB family protein